MALKDNLVSHLKFDGTIAANTRIDSHGEVHFQPFTSIPVGTGKLGNCATIASSNYLSPVANKASVWTPGNVDFACGLWVKLGTLTGSLQVIIGKYNTASLREWCLYYDHATSQFGIFVSHDGVATSTKLATTFGAVSTGVWYYLFGYHQASTLAGISVNAGTRDTVSHTTGVYQGAAEVRIGQTAGVMPFNGDVDEVSFWSGGIPSTADVSEIYNSGSGLAFSLWDPVASTVICRRS